MIFGMHVRLVAFCRSINHHDSASAVVLLSAAG